MLTAALVVAFVLVLFGLLLRPQHAELLMPLACLLGGALLIVVLQDSGLWPDANNPQLDAPGRVLPAPRP